MAQNSINNEAPFRIETPRLVITEFTPEMAEDVHLNSLDEDNRRFVPDEVFETVEDARGTVEYLISRYGGTEGPFVYPVLTKAGENIGYVQLVPFTEGWEIGYHIAKKYTGRGYASEAVSAFLPVMAETHGLAEIYGVCLAENAASARVMEKCGFTTLYRGVGPYQGAEREIVKTVWRAPAGKEEKPMEDVLFECRYTRDEALMAEVSRFMLIRLPRLYAVAVLYAVALGMNIYLIVRSITYVGTIYFLSWVMLVVLLLLPVYFWWNRRRMRKMQERGLKELYGDQPIEMTLRVTEHGIRLKDSTRSEERELPFSAFKKVYDSKNTLLLVSRAKLLFTFKKTGFTKGTPEELKRFLKEKGIK